MGHRATRFGIRDRGICAREAIGERVGDGGARKCRRRGGVRADDLVVDGLPLHQRGSIGERDLAARVAVGGLCQGRCGLAITRRGVRKLLRNLCDVKGRGHFNGIRGRSLFANIRYRERLATIVRGRAIDAPVNVREVLIDGVSEREVGDVDAAVVFHREGVGGGGRVGAVVDRGQCLGYGNQRRPLGVQMRVGFDGVAERVGLRACRIRVPALEYIAVAQGGGTIFPRRRGRRVDGGRVCGGACGCVVAGLTLLVIGCRRSHGVGGVLVEVERMVLRPHGVDDIVGAGVGEIRVVGHDASSSNPFLC